MTELVKKEGVVSKVRHKIYDQQHTVSFYLDKTQIYMKHYAPIPVENEDSIEVAGHMDGSGLLKAVALKNKERNAFLPNKNVPTGAGCAMTMYIIASLSLVVAIANFKSALFITPLLTALALIYIGKRIKKSGRKLQEAVNLISD